MAHSIDQRKNVMYDVKVKDSLIPYSITGNELMNNKTHFNCLIDYY